MNSFIQLCGELGVPIAHDKTESPSSALTYLGLKLDTRTLQIKIPEEKVKRLLQQIKDILKYKKVFLKDLQSLSGSLAFCVRALPPARAFLRRLYSAMSGVQSKFHHIRLTKGIK